MKIKIIVMIATLSSTMSAIAGHVTNTVPSTVYYGMDGTYAGIQAGIAIPSSGLDAGPIVGLQMGHGFNNGFRVEAALMWLNNERNDATAKSRNNSFLTMANIYYDFSTNTIVTPFLGVGIGLIHTNAKVDPHCFGCTDTSISDNNLEWQGIAGLAFRFRPNWSLDTTYHYLGNQFRGNLVTVGLNYFFNN